MDMDLLIVLVSLCGLGLHAYRFGADSRQTARSEEHELARRGLVWQRVPRPVRASARRRGRGA
jgi:hypothetical protein